MCGIIGGALTAGSKAADIKRLLLNGLWRMEYRGYDSAGVAICGDDGKVQTQVTVGRVAALKRDCASLAAGRVGIGHTRWATHGAPSKTNAHPIQAGKVFVVHNGIIENYAALKSELTAAGCVFCSDTDTEVIVHLLDRALAKKDDLLAALQAVKGRLQGAYAFAAMTASGSIVCIRQGTPLLAGRDSKGNIFIASDTQALAGEINAIHYFDNGEYALLQNNELHIWGSDDKPVKFSWQPTTLTAVETSLGEFRHFMRKEIADQPDAAAATMERWTAGAKIPMRAFGSGAAHVFRRAQNITIIACGTSYHAGLVARHWLARFGIVAQVEVASEYRYTRAATNQQSASGGALLIAISQSGETADTLAAMREAKAQGANTLAIVNVEHSTLAREADFVFHTHAGAEISVASTKAFTAQMTALLLITLAIAQTRKRISDDESASIMQQLRQLPHLLQKALLLEDETKQWASQLAHYKSAIYIGRRTHYPIALEGALKLKEISYIHAEGIAAGELKHGSLALVDDELPVVGLIPADDLQHKIAASLSEVAARGGQLFTLGSSPAAPVANARHIHIADDGGEFLSPLIYTIPLQLLAYHTARQKGTDIDKPRNLAKSVTTA